MDANFFSWSEPDLSHISNDAIYATLSLISFKWTGLQETYI